MYKGFIKRFLDIFLSLIALVILALPLLIVMITIKINMGSPVIFKQERAGKNGKTFKMFKFRSMKNAVDEYGIPLADEKRITKVGAFIRKTSLDELPSLINIIKGDMSIVGPRPLPIKYLPYYSEEEQKRHDVRGGLTGLAQVNGRNALSWEDRFSYDIEYVNKISFGLDVKILFQTIKKVFIRENIGVRGVDTPLDFDVYRSGKTEHQLYAKREEKSNE